MKTRPATPAFAPRRRKALSAGQRLGLILLFVVPAGLILGKSSDLPLADFLMRWLSLTAIPAELTDRVHYVLFVPLGALLVVIFRLVLGIRLLGPFRSVLIAVAFQMTGILVGLAFLVVIIAIMVALRPFLKTLRLPYFARVSAMLSAVSLLMVLAILACDGLGVAGVERVAYFPIVVICLTAEGFARTLNKEGFPSALWRGGMTALVAVLITGTASIPALKILLAAYPELLLAQVGALVVIARYCDWRVLERANPAADQRTSGAKSKTGLRRAGRTKQAAAEIPAVEASPMPCPPGHSPGKA